MSNLASVACGDPARNGVTIKAATHRAEEVAPIADITARNLLKVACDKESQMCKELLQSSFETNEHVNISASSNGFVASAITAYSRHHHLRIRPDDVWTAILTQFSFYVNAHAEELRSRFVAHEGKTLLEVKAAGNRYTVDFGRMAQRMTDHIDQNVVDPTLRGWIIPNFSTTHKNDITVAAVLMMSTFQKYFEFKFTLMCGIPTVTLLGERADWENILHRLEKLKEFGKECIAWYEMLHAVLRRFVESFNAPGSKEVRDFWEHICHVQNNGSGPTYILGWISAFCFWNGEGVALRNDPKLYTPHKTPQSPDIALPTARHSNVGDRLTKVMSNISKRSMPICEKTVYGHRGTIERPTYALDGVDFHRVDDEDIPIGYGSVPVLVDDNGYKFPSLMVAGSVGYLATASGKPLDDGKLGNDTLQPVTGWWMFERDQEGEDKVAKDNEYIRDYIERLERMTTRT